MPFADLGEFDQRSTAERRLRAVTVGLVIRYITWKLGEGVGNGTNSPVTFPLAGNPLPVQKVGS